MKDAKCAKCRSLECYYGKDCFGMAEKMLGLYGEKDRKSMRLRPKSRLATTWNTAG